MLSVEALYSYGCVPLFVLRCLMDVPSFCRTTLSLLCCLFRKLPIEQYYYMTQNKKSDVYGNDSL